MILSDYLEALRRGWSVIVICVLLGGLVGALLWWATPARYQSTSSVYLSAADEVGAASLSQLSNYMESQVVTYSLLVNKPVVLSRAEEQIGQGISVHDISGMVSVNIPTESYIIEISATSEDPALAASVSNAVSNGLASAVADLAPQNEGEPVVRLNRIQDATPSSVPSRSSVIVYLGAGSVLGLIAGLGVALARQSLRATSKVDENFA